MNIKWIAFVVCLFVFCRAREMSEQKKTMLYCFFGGGSIITFVFHSSNVVPNILILDTRQTRGKLFEASSQKVLYFFSKSRDLAM